MPAQPDLPLRPMTLGELLDAAISLLRARALPLIGVAAVLALLEQVLLVPVRVAAHLTPPFYLPANGHFVLWWGATTLGSAIEAFILVLLGALAAAAAGPALIDRPLRHRELWSRTRPLATVCTAVLLGVACAAGFFAGAVLWLILFGLFGLATSVLVIDRSGNPFTALGRSARLAARGGLRGFWVLSAAYVTWFAIRFMLGSGWVPIQSLFSDPDPDWLVWVTPAAWAMVNTVAYSALACVAAVVSLEARIRSEGLDIAIGRARARGEDDAAPLAYTR
jgi:hypothetical protein